jgi:hypothetical protein
LASFLGSDYPSNLGARTAPPAKDLMAFGSVLAHNQNQHNIGEFSKFQFNSIFFFISDGFKISSSLICRILTFFFRYYFFCNIFTLNAIFMPVGETIIEVNEKL